MSRSTVVTEGTVLWFTEPRPYGAEVFVIDRLHATKHSLGSIYPTVGRPPPRGELVKHTPQIWTRLNRQASDMVRTYAASTPGIGGHFEQVANDREARNRWEPVRKKLLGNGRKQNGAKKRHKDPHIEAGRKYDAGWKTAEVDFKRGMSAKGMRAVPQKTDDPDWATGYRNRAEQLIAGKKKMKKKAAKKAERVCASSGYAYKLDGNPDKWRTTKDDNWEIVVIDGGPVTLLGKRHIDGVEACVFKKGSKVYAQTCMHVSKC